DTYKTQDQKHNVKSSSAAEMALAEKTLTQPSFSTDRMEMSCELTDLIVWGMEQLRARRNCGYALTCGLASTLSKPGHIRFHQSGTHERVGA
ncbi:hypothetical protein AVEN_67576-1, partial [Araneus ventricosus]